MRLSTHQLTVRHGDVRALSDVALTFEPGAQVLILGVAGSGKTTLLKSLAGLRAPSAGHVAWDGAVVESLSTADKRARQSAFGMTFQSDALFDSMTVFENVLLPLRKRGVKPEDASARVDHVLAQVGLREAKHQLPSELSGGMRKRVGIARAVVAQPSVLLADDPMAGLDPRTAREVGEVLMASARGRTLIVAAVEPQASLALPRWVALTHGKVFHDGPASSSVLNALDDEPEELAS